MSQIPHLLFFGSMMLPEECQRNPGCSFSANRFQYELSSGLLAGHVGRVTAICPVPVRSFPQDRPLVFPAREQMPQPGFTISSPVFINWGPLKVLSLILTVFVAALRKCATAGKPQVIMLYNPYLGYALPALLLARLWHIPAAAIVADVNPPTPLRLRGLARQLETRLQRWTIRHFDGLLPFSIYVAHDFQFQRPVMRLDPGVNASDFEAAPPLPSAQCQRVLMFSGTLNLATGLSVLLDAFEQVTDPTIHLWISGRGDMQALVEAMVRQNQRVHYLGFVEREELLRTMRHSLILVNPRPPSLPEHRYNFPSKILEYLAVGRPVISTASADLAEEYGDYLLLADETPETFAHLIESSFAKDPHELDAIGLRGREYVLAEKNWRVLSSKVAHFLGTLTGCNTP